MDTLNDWIETGQDGLVDPVLRAKIYELVNAVGGASIDNDGRYELGQDCELALKDLTSWLHQHDHRRNLLEAKRCMAEANLLEGDLLEILAIWPEGAWNKKFRMFKIARRILRMLITMTEPMTFDDNMTIHHHKHLPYLQLAQVRYKRAILQHESQMLRTVVRLALPIMAEAKGDRKGEDDVLLTGVLRFLKNTAIIMQPQNLPGEGDEAEISRSATIEAFHKQDILQLLLTMSSMMGEDFERQDTEILETLFHLLKGVDPDKLFMEEKRLASANTDELKGLMQKEKAMKAGYARHAPTRHNRFGTMIWVKRDDERVSTVIGQDVLGNAQRTLQKMDKSKKWNKPKHRGKADEEDRKLAFDLQTLLTPSARKHLRHFVTEFLDSSFNPLFAHLRRTLEREPDRVLSEHYLQFFYLISWFLQAEMSRRKRSKEGKHASSLPEDESFGLVASVLNQETFILLNRHMQRAHDDKSWRTLNSTMKAFTQILLTVQEMTYSKLDDDLEIAENIQNRIFYEEVTHDRIINILKSYKDQGFGYLDACTELAHVFLRMLERYSKENVDLQVRSRRRARRRKKEAIQRNPESHPDADGGEEDYEAEDRHEAETTVRERKFDFMRFQARLMTQSCINTYVSLTRYYNDLNAEQLKRAHGFFYRVAFKMELGILLYRVDILLLFQTMIKGSEPMDKDLAAYTEWEELTGQIFKKVIKKVQVRPELVVEMLFSKINATTYYLEHGYDREVVTRAPRPPAELEVKPGMERDAQIGVAVGVLIDQNKSDALAWVKAVLSSAAEERQSWQDADAARKAVLEAEFEGMDESERPEQGEQPKAPSITVKPENDERRVQLFKDNKVRLLLTLLGCERLGLDEDADASWIIPSSVSAESLKESLELIGKFEFDPPTYENGKLAEDFLRSKAAARRRRAEFDNSDDDAGEISDSELFPVGGPTERKSDALKELKSRRKRNRHEPIELDDAEKDRRADARRKADLEKRKKIKSDLFVHDSDDESDDERDKEFFAQEEERRKNAAGGILCAMTATKFNEGKKEKPSKKRKAASAPKGKKKRKTVESEPEDEEDTALSSGDEIRNAPHTGSRSSSVAQKRTIELSSDDESEGAEQTDTPLSSQQRDTAAASPPASKPAITEPVLDTDMGGIDDEPVRKAPPVRRNMRAGFFLDSDSDD